MTLKTRGFAHRIDIAVDPPKVWTVLCGPTLMPLWMGTDARIKPQKGGHWSGTTAPGFHREAIIDVFDPPRRLRLIYLTPPDLPVFDGAVVDDYLIDAEGPATVVRLLCSGVPDLPEWSAHFMKARLQAERALARLKVLCEQRERMAQASLLRRSSTPGR
jgi:uncharacterized protein YndB with AHSA1/START domain